MLHRFRLTFFAVIHIITRLSYFKSFNYVTSLPVCKVFIHFFLQNNTLVGIMWVLHQSSLGSGNYLDWECFEVSGMRCEVPHMRYSVVGIDSEG